VRAVVDVSAQIHEQEKHANGQKQPSKSQQIGKFHLQELHNEKAK
jgi:hypothetical protein